MNNNNKIKVNQDKVSPLQWVLLILFINKL